MNKNINEMLDKIEKIVKNITSVENVIEEDGREKMIIICDSIDTDQTTEVCNVAMDFKKSINVSCHKKGKARICLYDAIPELESID